MPDSIFCPKCGTSNQPDFMYCTSCGFALSTISKAGPEKTTPPYTAPVQNQPAAVAPAKATSALPRWAPAVIIIVVLAGIGFLIWNSEQSKRKNPSGRESDLTGKNENGLSVITDRDKIKAKDFAGVWRPYESNDPEGDNVKIGDPKDDLFIEVSNGRIDMYPRNELDEEDRSLNVTCGEVVGNTISCILKSKGNPDGTAGSIKMELQPSKNEMIFTITQGLSEEKLIVKARRLNETEN